MKVFKMGWRGIWRNRRRTGVTVAATSLGLLTMILYAGLMEGYLRGMEASVLDLEVGDMQVHADDYRENPSIYTRIQDPEALIAPLEAAGLRATGRLLAFGMAASGDASAGVSFRGVDVERDARVSLIHDQLAQGSWLDPAEPSQVVLGRRIARTLAVEPGDELLVLSQGADGSMAYDLYTVRGILLGVSAATDRTGMFMTQAAFRELFVVPDGVHQIIVRRPADLDLASAAVRVQGLAGALDVRTWRQLLPTVASMMDSARAAIVVMFVIIYIAIGILILNAMLMAVFERVREFGVMKALGVSPLGVLRLILVESAIMTGIAIAIGVGLGVPGLIYLSEVGLNLSSLAGVSIMGLAMDPHWRAVITPDVFRLPIVTLVSIVAIAVVYPAVKASLISPIEAMRYR
ncbi:MAG: ABC transporter permease [Deltaproteobacteria bacterium]|nr:ABC transporter permease [Deltaproteobacteria bacterium]